LSYEQIDTKIDIPKLEKEILKFWFEAEAYNKRLTLQQGRAKWSFIDGPITANNPMGVHHAWGRTYKDLWARYWFMRGREVRYQNGFDCQGLWVEVEVEKDLGFKSKTDIEDFGIADFVTRCKQRVLTYAAEQTEQSIRLGMWTEWDNPEELKRLKRSLDKPLEKITYNSPRGKVTDFPETIVGNLGSPELGGSYYTLSDENNYMIWAALKSCYDRGWIYKGMDSMPWCPRCSTGISQHEIVTEGYREITHPSIYVKFPLKNREGSLLIWTTTPWTLTSNVAVAAHPELEYVKVEYMENIYYISKGTLEQVFPQGNYVLLEEIKGSEMEGWTYKGPYDEMEIPQSMEVQKAHRVVMWEEVGENEGTGLVHIAPGAGKEDLELGKLYNLPAVAPLDEFGIIIKGFDWLSGIHVYETPTLIFDDLRNKKLLFRVEDVTHRYPVCWRCGSELVFRYVGEWFINMGEKIAKPLENLTDKEKTRNLRYQIMESAIETKWIPEFGLKRELDWLGNMDDWMISKKRYWGLALPIWTCDCGWFYVIGSKEELKELAIEGWEEFKAHSPHRPYIDKVKIRCER
jgi:isoleucyl-tRNA synthetase